MHAALALLAWVRLFKTSQMAFISTAVIDINWNVGFGNTLVGIGTGTQIVSPAPYSLNSGAPIDNITFLNVSQTLDEATSVNFGYPPGDSFIIRTS